MRQVPIYDRTDGKVKIWSISESLFNKIYDSVKNEPSKEVKNIEVKRKGQEYVVRVTLSIFKRIRRWIKDFKKERR